MTDAIPVPPGSTTYMITPAPLPDGTMPVLPHGLGRHVHHDPRNREHRALVRPPARQSIPNRTYSRTSIFDQGNSPSCTAHAAIGLLRTSPFASSFAQRHSYDDEMEIIAFYEESKDYDPWDGREYDGTSSDAPYRLLRAKGVIDEWKWLFGEAEVRKYVAWYGPCTIGVNWYENMFYPDPVSHFLDVSGPLAGGHEVELIQFKPNNPNTPTGKGRYKIVNSWGRGWGDNGRAWITSDDLALLLDQNGDAVTIAPLPEA